uniref:Uncharacterized protein n=1 Tax=Mycena chlorophos TaxID=658473 RepID=A0ABQ0L8M8_MYCCL|nr:predicted protein [Mycena chlorophos]
MRLLRHDKITISHDGTTICPVCPKKNQAKRALALVVAHILLAHGDTLALPKRRIYESFVRADSTSGVAASTASVDAGTMKTKTVVGAKRVEIGELDPETLKEIEPQMLAETSSWRSNTEMAAHWASSLENEMAGWGSQVGSAMQPLMEQSAIWTQELGLWVHATNEVQDISAILNSE